MRDGKHADGDHVLRAKIDMRSPNINMRDPALYACATPSTIAPGDKWHIYPMYTYAHPVEDALENITHSLCTLEFEDQRPFYDWVLEKIASFRPPAKARFRSRSSSRASTSRTPVMSKRFLKQLVDEKHVDGWDDPRMPTLVGLPAPRLHARRLQAPRRSRRRLEVRFVDRLLGARRLHARAPERGRAAPHRGARSAEARRRQLAARQGGRVLRAEPPAEGGLGQAPIPFSSELWIEREDFMAEPSKGYFRLFPGNTVRLKYGYVVRCTGYSKDSSGTSPKSTATTSRIRSRERRARTSTR
jgi:glutaminyl-tRNA synthetase